jgi:pteridine reductase
MQNSKVVLITGGARRVGAVMARHLHAQNMRIVIHYRSSVKDAQNLCDELNSKRANSATILQADLNDTQALPGLIQATSQIWGQLDVLINNASSFYPTPLGEVNEQQWDDLLASNLKGPFFLAQAAAPLLIKQQGCIINMVDIRASKPLKDFSAYCIAKAGLLMMTKILAKELAPAVRVNGIAPGVVLWPDDDSEYDEATRKKILARTPLKRAGTPEDIANTATFLINHADYITGQIIAVDGGRTLDA